MRCTAWTILYLAKQLGRSGWDGWQCILLDGLAHRMVVKTDRIVLVVR